MTAPASLPRCVHGNVPMYVENSTDLGCHLETRHIGTRLCDCGVWAPTEAAAIAAWTALCRPAHAVTEVERLLREARRWIDGVIDGEADDLLSRIDAALADAKQGGGE